MNSKLLVRSMFSMTITASLACALHFQDAAKAEACGCFVPPDPTVPIVQAGERILFSMEDGIVTSHIQVQYSGPAAEFGWLLPMPSIPSMELGTDELFTQLIAQTQPTYKLKREYQGNCPFDPTLGRKNNQSPRPDDSSSEGGKNGSSPLILRDSVGPFDYAVLKADKKKPMLDWLKENGFFVPAGTDDVVGPYIQKNGYFLALKLLKGSDVGDIQPIVLKYQSDLPMIPIILTSVAADPNMAVQVWILGKSRAIPRNYNHTKINDAALDWINAGANYLDVVTNAVDEIDGHHSFVTEYAGTSDVMEDRLDYQNRFGMTAQLSVKNTIVDFIQYMNANGYARGASYPSQVLNILKTHFPMPQKLIDDEIDTTEYYRNIGFYLGKYKERFPEKFLDLDEDFIASDVAAELEERIVKPTLAAGQLFRVHPYLSRLFTTLSPNEMTKDPVFSFNPDLADVSNEHIGTLTYYCQMINNPEQETTPAVLVTEQGFELVYSDGTGERTKNPFVSLDMPQSQYQEILREEGKAEVVTDNTKRIQTAIDSLNQKTHNGGCSVSTQSGNAGWLFLAVFFFILRRRKEA